jgi:hypothetical protein
MCTPSGILQLRYYFFYCLLDAIHPKFLHYMMKLLFDANELLLRLESPQMY